MRCIIIEDEQHAAEHLEYLLSECRQDIVVETRLDSVKSAVDWLRQHTTELIFLDIQLGDDESFTIFDNVQVTTPVIFTTSYNEFAIRSFQLNSIAYLLKPIDMEELQSALDKFEQLFALPRNYDALIRTQHPYQRRFLVQSGNNLHSVSVDDIAYFFVQGKHLFITARNGTQYLFDSTLDAIESKLDPEVFFRINRQYMIAVHSIEKMHNHTRGRVIVETSPVAKEEMVVSIERANDFKNWLNR